MNTLSPIIPRIPPEKELSYSPRTDTADIRRGKLVCGRGYSGMFDSFDHHVLIDILQAH